MPQREFISRFSPNRTDPEILEKIFVQRQDLLEQSVAALRESALTKNKHHLLFVGPRGCGKTHLLALIVHRLQQQADLADRLRIAWLNEDETSISFLDLLLRIYRALSDRYPEEFPRENLRKLYGQDREEAQNALSEDLIRRIGKRTLLVLVENLDVLFDRLEDSEQRTWRAFIQNHPIFATAATAQSLFAGVSQREQPFFGFFDTRHLRQLTVEEATELLQRIARLNDEAKLTDFLSTSRGRARVRAIHHLSGGNPRLYIVLSDFITQDSLDELVRAFEELVDEQLTPYYQERLRWLSPLQRKIVEFLCFRPGPVAVKVIADRLFAEHGTITSQLKKLREMHYVSGQPRGRESLYELEEPLMRLSMQVKDTRDHQPLGLIVDFLRVWYERDELEERLAKMDATAATRQYFTKALGKLLSGEPNLRHQLLRDALVEHQGASSEDVAAALYNRGAAFQQAGRTQEAISDYTSLLERPDVPIYEFACALLDRGYIFFQTGKLALAIADFTRLVELSDAPPDQVSNALLNRAVAFAQIGRTRESLADLARVVQMPSAPPDAIVGAYYDRGVVLGQVGRREEAIAAYTRAIEWPGAPTNHVAAGLNNRGTEFAEAGRTDEATSDWTHVIELAGAPVEALAMALNNRALQLGKVGQTTRAIADYERILNLPQVPPLQAAKARLKLAESLFWLDQWDAGIKALADSLSEKTPFSIENVSDAVLGAIFRHIGSPEVWQARCKMAAELYAEHRCATHLGDALVRHLAELAKSLLNSAGLDQWLAGWEQATPRGKGMELPLRLLRVGIAYLKTEPHDETVLLGLPKEERSLVRQALGLPAQQLE